MYKAMIFFLMDILFRIFTAYHLVNKMMDTN